jgi:uncharacterized SAM-binding protein YcdF (DUF218 family)
LQPGALQITCGLSCSPVFIDLRCRGLWASSAKVWPRAYVAVRLFESLGLPAARVEFEAKSRNTAENALFAKQLVAPKVGERWLLVTSALHMPRAVGAFRAVGFPVEAHPVDWRTEGPRALMSISGSAVDGLLVTDAAIHEWVGLLAYWITGRTSELLPGPK